MRSSVMNLREITDTILRDVGATLQLLRVVGEEYRDGECRPTRIEHCIASLNRERWYDTVCAAVIDSHDKEVSAAWSLFSCNAHHTRQVALRIEGFSPEEAYLVGLLHQIGKLPQLLGWTCESTYTIAEERAVGMLLAQHWRAPGYLIEAMRQQSEGSLSSRWSFLLHSAQCEYRDQVKVDSAVHPVHP